MSKIKSIIRENYHKIIFTVFLTIHALTCCFTTYYGDDYYYAAFVRNGAEYFVSENIFHYQFTNGRVLVHILDELLIGWSFWLWRIADVIVVALLVLAIAKIAARAYRIDIASRKDEYRIALIAACALFCITEVTVLRQSVYWATGSLNYLFPTTALLWFYYYFRRDFERFRGSWLLIIAAFFASVTTEQASAAALLVTLCFIVSSFVVKRMPPRPVYFGAFGASLLGLSLLILAPGNSERQKYHPEFYARSFLGKIKHNLSELASVIFGRGGIYPILCVAFVMVIFICLKNYSGKLIPRRKRIPAMFLAGETVLVLGLYIQGLTIRPELLQKVWFVILLIIPILSAMAWSAVMYFKKGSIDNLYFIWCAVSMQLAMLVSPEYGPRTLLISIFSLTVPVVRLIAVNHTSKISTVRFYVPAFYIFVSIVIFALLPWYVPSIGLFVTVLAVIAVAAVLLASLYKVPDARTLTAFFTVGVCLAQFATVAYGYSMNTAMIARNSQQIENYKADGKSEPLIIYYLPNDIYKYTMPYDNPYHEYVFRRLHGIDSNTTIFYEFYFDSVE